ncbi:MAG: phosphoglycerate kinase [Flavobacteriaceae bacterium]
MVSLDKENFKWKRVIIRVDYNVPVENNKILDETRIAKSKPTIQKIINDGGSCILMSHMGRPKGKDKEFSFNKILFQIEKTLDLKVVLVENFLEKKSIKKIKSIKPGDVILLENLRFYPEETKGDENFAKKLASLADCYVNDAFGTSHRRHASTTEIAKYFPKKKFSGYLLKKEVESIKNVLNDGKRPVLAIVGGAKISTKITVINSILDKVDDIIIGGGMAYTFIKALGGQIGNSIFEKEYLDEASLILVNAKSKGVKIHLPTDVICSLEFRNDSKKKNFDADKIPDQWQGLDIGPNTSKLFNKIIMQSKTILWNGPVGVFEMESFSHGTKALGESIVKSTKNGAFSLVGGGDSVAAAKKFNFSNKLSYVSTGGGAMLESLEGKKLPGIEALSD